MALGRIKIEESSTITAKMATQALTRNSSTMHQEIVSLGDPLDPAIIAECSSGAPTSSQAGLVVRQVGFSTTVQVSSLAGAVITRSTAAEMLVTAYQSTAANLLATIYPQSTSAANSNSSAVLVRVVAGVSSAVDFPVRAVLSSTSADNVMTVSTVQGAVIVRSSAADQLVTAYQSTASAFLATIYPQSSAVQNSNSSAVLVRVVGGVSSGVDFPVRALLSSTSADNVITVSTVQGAVIVRSSAADQLVTAYQSTAGNLLITAYQSTAANLLATIYPQSSAAQNSNSSAVLVRVVGGVSSGVDFPVRAILSSTVTDNVVNVSSVAGIVAIRGSDTNWASSAGFHFDSSGALQITGATSSTQVAVSSVAGAVIVRSSAADQLVTVYQSTASALLATIYPQSSAVQNSNSSAVLVRVVGGVSSGVDFPVRALLSSTVTDNVVNVSSVAGVVAIRGSDTNWASSAGFHFDSSGALNVSGATASTQVAVSSLAGAVIVRSSAADQLVTAYQSTAANFLATIYPQSSAVQNSNSSAVLVRVVGGVSSGVDFPVRALLSSTSADNPVTATPSAGSTWPVRAFQSSASELKVSAFLFDSTGNAIDVSTVSMSSGARGIYVRSVIPGSTTYAASTAGQSSMTSILTSNATTRGYVFGYSVTSTLAGPVQWGIYSNSGATLLWTGILAAVSSAISGANLAVTPPGYLFRGSTGANLTFNCATSNAGLSVSVAMFRST